MAKSPEVKTKKNKASVEDFINAVKDEQTRADCFEIVKMMKQVTKAEPVMWGSSIVGFGEYMMTYANGSQLPWPIASFSPRKQYITIYINPEFKTYGKLLKKLGKHSTAKVCLYIKKLADVDKAVLKEIITESVRAMKKVSD